MDFDHISFLKVRCFLDINVEIIGDIICQPAEYDPCTALLCLYLHSNASSGTLLHILHTYAIFVYFALVPSHALGA